MAEPGPLRIEYESHENVRRLLKTIAYCLEGISLNFDRWDDPYVVGPGMYVAIIAGPSLSSYADPMGEERWPVKDCRSVTDPDFNSFYTTATKVSRGGDGAVVVSVDGVIYERMVRFRTPPGVDDENPDYAPWMGSRHMSALDVSYHPEVVGTVTLSEESGRVTIFRDGSYESTERSEFGRRWRGAE